MKNNTINLFKLLSTYFVVGIHCFVFFRVNIQEYIHLQSIFAIAVPFFFISSGYFISIGLRKKIGYDKKIYLKKYLLNLLKTYILYTLIDGILIYLEYKYILKININIFNWIFSIRTLFGFNQGGFFYPIWFLMVLIQSHLIINLLNKKIRIEKLTLYSLLIYMLFYFLQLSSILPVNRTVFSIGLIFTSLGYFIGENKDKIENLTYFKSNKIILLSILLLIMILVCEFKYIYLSFNMYFASYLTLIPLSILIFIFLIKNPNIIKSKKINVISENTFGVYLIHSFLLRVLILILEHYNISLFFIPNTFVFLLFIAFVYIVSFIVYYGGLKLYKIFIKNK